jgi:hypothetical protein
MAVNGSKFCNTCKTLKSTSEFHARNNTACGTAPKCKTCLKQKHKKRYAEKREQILAKNAEWRRNNKDYILVKGQLSYYANIDRYKQNSVNNRENRNRRKIERKASDPFFRLKMSWRELIRKAIKRNKGYRNSTKSTELLGCDIQTARKHLESKFKPGMSWENHGEWHIDHIVPLHFATNETELIKLLHYENMQPLWAVENIRKGTKILANVG